jgi:L-ribulose-5-phosphate 4-epimerase
MLESLRKQVCDANVELVRQGLVLATFGNASAVSRAEGLVVIKPSGVPYDALTPDDMVVTDLDGGIVAGKLKPSVDLGTHLELYRRFPRIGAVVHTHSAFATVWAQARRAIPALGTTHADYFFGPIPVTRDLSDEEVTGDFVRNTGAVIAETFGNRDPAAVPAALVAGHGPFCWGTTPADAVHNAVILEAVAKIAFNTLQLQPNAVELSPSLLARHFLRKHGATATYGQVIGETDAGR